MDLARYVQTLSHEWPVVMCFQDVRRSSRILLHFIAALVESQARKELPFTVELLSQPIGYRWARNLAPFKAAEPQALVGYFDSMASSSSTPIARAARVVTP